MTGKPFHNALRAGSLFFFFFFATCPNALQASEKNPFHSVKPPNADWKLRRISPSEIEVFLASMPKAVNVGLRVMKGVPIENQNFLDQVRTKAVEDPEVKGAEIGLIRSREIGGKTWNYFILKRKDEINQEFWARKLKPDEVFIVLYTAVGTYYDQYQPEFLKILETASKN